MAARHIHTFSPVEPGLDVCTDCDAVQRNPHTAPDHTLDECGCGRGLARFLDGDRTPEPLCSACFQEHVTEGVAA